MIENAFVIGLILVVCVLTDVMILALSKILPRYNLTDLKRSRWEAGNLPVPNPKSALPIQYLGFMFIFMAVEPILVTLFIFAAYPGLNFYIILIVSLLIVLPAIYVGVKVTKEGI